MRNNDLTIAVLSGKGGTGKTLVSVNLAALLPDSTYIDCDVEEPDGHLFFKPVFGTSVPVMVKTPQVDENRCTGCHACVDFCKFNALALIGSTLMVFNEICHSCGGCVLVCPRKALSEKERMVGFVREGISRGVQVVTGTMNIGESSGVPIIEAELRIKEKNINNLTFIDCPPGSACLVRKSIQEADYCLLVAEPTVFGAHNLAMVYALVSSLHKRFSLVLNKCLGGEENPSEVFAIEHQIPIVGRIPFDSELGLLNSEAKVVVWESEKYRQLFSSILTTVLREAHHEATGNS